MVGSLLMGGVFSVKPLANPLVSGAVTVLEGGLFLVFSGTFSFCAAVSTEIVFTVVVIPDVEDTDMEAAAVFFCCFFFLLALEVGASLLGGRFGGQEVTAEGLLLPPLTVSREEISNMVGTERNSCCVILPLSSSEEGGDRVNVAFPLSPTFFFLREHEEVVEERSWGPEDADESGGVGLEEGGGWVAGLAVAL